MENFTLAELAEQVEAEAIAISQLSIFQQPAAIKQLLPTLTGLIKTLCTTVDNQQQQIKKITGGY